MIISSPKTSWRGRYSWWWGQRWFWRGGRYVALTRVVLAEFTAAPALICIAAAAAADGWHDHPREDQHQFAADHQHWKHYHNWYITWLLSTTTAIDWWEDYQGTTQVSISVLILEKWICWNFETLWKILTKCINWHIGLCRPSQLAELSHSEFDPELFSHSAYVQFSHSLSIYSQPGWHNLCSPVFK